MGALKDVVAVVGAGVLIAFVLWAVWSCFRGLIDAVVRECWRESYAEARLTDVEKKADTARFEFQELGYELRALQESLKQPVRQPATRKRK